MKRNVLLIPLLAAALLLTACGGEQESTDTAAAVSVTEAAPETGVVTEDEIVTEAATFPDIPDCCGDALPADEGACCAVTPTEAPTDCCDDGAQDCCADDAGDCCAAQPTEVTEIVIPNCCG